MIVILIEKIIKKKRKLLNKLQVLYLHQLLKMLQLLQVSQLKLFKNQLRLKLFPLQKSKLFKLQKLPSLLPQLKLDTNRKSHFQLPNQLPKFKFKLFK